MNIIKFLTKLFGLEYGLFCAKLPAMFDMILTDLREEAVLKGRKERGQKEYMSVADLEVYSSISQRTLWDLIKSPVNPIPHFRVGTAGRIVRVKRSEFDRWIEGYRVSDDADIDNLVKEILG
jgi:hypothetical protein